MILFIYLAIAFFCSNCALVCGHIDSAYESKNVPLVTISGKVFPPDYILNPSNWQAETELILKGGIQKSFVREDGTFSFYNILPGSYVLEVLNPTHSYEQLRVEVNSKGKIRARKVNYIQASQVIQVAYPLKIKPLGMTRYFQQREQWRITDFLFHPMILMMVVPLLFLMLLPRMMNDPDARKEMEQLSNLTKYSDIPEMSEVIIAILGRGSQQKGKNQKQVKKTNKNNS